MNYLVCIKQVPDTTTKMIIEENGMGKLNLSNIKWIINPYDEMAIEEALLLSQKSSSDSKIYVVSVGPERVKEVLRTALAMGAHEAIHIDTKKELDSVAVAQSIAESLKDKLQNIDLILCGKLGIDGGFSSMPAALAGFLKWPNVSCVSKIEVCDEVINLHQLLDGGDSHIFKIQKPLVVSVTKGINQPRYPSLPGIMKAKSKPLDSLALPASIESGISIEKIEYPKKRPPVQMIEGSPEEQSQKLISLLKKEGVL